MLLFAFLPLLLKWGPSILSMLGGFFGGSRSPIPGMPKGFNPFDPQTSTSDSTVRQQGSIDHIFDTFEERTQRGTQRTTSDTTTQPFAVPGFENLTGLLRDFAERRAVSTPDTRGLVANQVAGVNRSFEGINQAITNSLAERGAGTPSDSASALTAGDRGSAIAQVLGNAPLQTRSLEDEGSQLASSILQAFGTGQSQKGVQEVISDMVDTLTRHGSESETRDLTTTQTSSNTGINPSLLNPSLYGGGFSGGMEGITAILLYLMGSGLLGKGLGGNTFGVTGGVPSNVPQQGGLFS